MTASVIDSSTKKIAVGGVQAIHAMLSMRYLLPLDARRRLSPHAGRGLG
jgi:hypothetical protein